MLYKQSHADVSKGFKRTPVVRRETIDIDKNAPVFEDGNLRSIKYDIVPNYCLNNVICLYMKDLHDVAQ